MKAACSDGSTRVTFARYMLPRSGFLLADSKSNSSTRLPLRTTTRVSSGWEASMIILLDMCNSRRARAGGSVRPGWALEVQARRAKVGRKKVKRTRRPGDGPASVKAKRIGCAATAAPRVRARGPTDNLLRPGHDDPETRRTRTSSPFEGRRQSANVSQRLAIAGPGPARRIFRIRPRTRCATLSRNTKKTTNVQICAYATRQSSFAVALRRAALPRIERGRRCGDAPDAKQVVHRRPDASWQADSPWSVWRTGGGRAAPSN